MKRINPERIIPYRLDEKVSITDPFSPYEYSVGRLVQLDNTKLRYTVEFSGGQRDSFWYHQIAPYRPSEDLQAMIDLALTLGPAAQDMFNDWVIELKQRKT